MGFMIPIRYHLLGLETSHEPWVTKGRQVLDCACPLALWKREDALLLRTGIGPAVAHFLGKRQGTAAKTLSRRSEMRRDSRSQWAPKLWD